MPPGLAIRVLCTSADREALKNAMLDSGVFKDVSTVENHIEKLLKVTAKRQADYLDELGFKVVKITIRPGLEEEL